MKKLINILSWASVVCLGIAILIASMQTGCVVCNYLRQLWHMGGYEVFVLVPVFLVVAVAVELFFMLGMSKYGKAMNNI